MSLTPETITPEPSKKETGTTYVILRQSPADRPTYEWVAEATATSSLGALRAAKGLNEGTYVAVPSRSFMPVRVSLETVTRVKVEQA